MARDSKEVRITDVSNSLDAEFLPEKTRGVLQNFYRELDIIGIPASGPVGSRFFIQAARKSVVTEKQPSFWNSNLPATPPVGFVGKYFALSALERCLHLNIK